MLLNPRMVCAVGEVTLDECLKRADSQNSGLKASQQSRDAAQSSKQISWASFFPSLQMKAHYTLTDRPDRLLVVRDSLAPGLPVQDVDLADGHRDRYQLGVYLNQPLFTGGSLMHAYDRSRYQLFAAESDVKYQRVLLFEQVKKTFYRLLAAEVQIEAARRRLESQVKLVQVVSRRLEEGLATREEFLLAGSELSEAEQKLVAAQQQAELLRSELRRLTSTALDEPLQPVGTFVRLSIETPLHEFLKYGVAQRDDLRSLRMQLKQKDAEVGIAQSGYFPNVTMQGAYVRQRETYATRSDVWSVTVNAEWNLFDWGKTASSVAKARALSRHDAFQLEEATRSALTEIEQLWREARKDLSLLLSLESRLKASEYAVERSMHLYQEGKIRQVDLYLKESLLWQSYAAYCQSAAELYGVMASLERALSRPMAHWSVAHTLYQPDFEGIDARIKALVPFEQAAVSVKSLPASTKEIVADVGKKPVKQAVHPPFAADAAGVQGKAGKQSRYYLQFGVFAQKDNAEQLYRSLKKRENEWFVVHIDTDSGLYRVVSGSYTSRNEALGSAKKLGIKQYLVKAAASP